MPVWLTARFGAELAARMSFLAFVVCGAFYDSRLLLALAFASGALAMLYYLVIAGGRIGRVLLVFLAAVFVSYPLVLLNNGFTQGYMHGGMVVASSGVALYFARTRRTGLLSFTLWGLLGWYFFAVFYRGVDPSTVLLGSGNRVSTLLLALAVLLLVIRRRSSDFPLATLVALACLLAGGASGIVSSAVLLLIVALRSLLDPGRFSGAKRVVLIGAIAAIAMVVPRLMTEAVMTRLAVARLFGEDVRYQVLRDYAAQNLHGAPLLTGVAFDYSFEVSSAFGGFERLENLHNSYISAHSKSGIFVVLILGAILVRLVALAWLDPYVAGLWLVLLMRAFADTVFILDGTYNFAFMLFLLPLPMLLGASPRYQRRLARARERGARAASSLRIAAAT